MRYKIIFSYDGTNFNGYQIQPNLRTVQKELQKAVSYLNQQTDTSVQSSGRTDKGVHALGQVAHFDLDVEISIEKIKRGLNSNLPKDIHIICVKKVSKNFHARFKAKKKEYTYKINIGEYDPLERNYIYQYNRPLDVAKMKEAIKYFEGTHDFTSFVSSEDIRENKVRTIFKTNIQKKNNIIEINFQSDGFMKYQVRNMVGLLIYIGCGKKEASDVQKMLTAKDRTQSVKTAPPEGLYLKKVWY
ncbi:MAG: tRNA pseudouridine(38-40) synthase TruA [bacterium]|nr:tRNA pseudouridine(38-40) synthase TruA [bacterium]